MKMRVKSQQSINRIVFSLFLIISATIFPFIECMYEDQVGKIDWSKQYVGKAIGGQFDSSNQQFVVATDQNVVAALNTKTGEINWRRILENEDRGFIQFFELIPDTDSANIAVIVTGTTVKLVRGWNCKTGNLAWEWTFNQQSTLDNKTEHWFISRSTLFYAALNKESSALEIASHDIRSGAIQSDKTVAIKSNGHGSCHFSKAYLICSSRGNVEATNIINGQTTTVAASSLSPRLLQGTSSVISVGNVIYDLESNVQFDSTLSPSNEYFTGKTNAGHTVILRSSAQQSDLLQIDSLNPKTNDFELVTTIKFPVHLGTLRIVDAICNTKHNDKLDCLLVFLSENSAIFLYESNEIKWLREESLADIAAVEMVDLPLADLEGAFEKQINDGNGDIIAGLAHRIRTQFNHIKHLARTIFNAVSTQQVSSQDKLTRDAFGLHMIIVAVTSCGKLFGIDNTSGKIHYAVNLPNFDRFNKDKTMKIVVQRTSKHFPQPARCSIVGRNKQTGSGLLYQFDPITGLPVDGGIIDLGFNIKQMAVLQPGPDFLRGILFLDEHNGVHVIPKESDSMAHGTYIYVSDTETGTMTGNHIEMKGQQLQAVEIWRTNLSGLDNSQKIIEIASKNPNEHVHSQGRVLYDRSVLYKYINPNLIAVVTQGNDNTYKYVLNIHMIDAVSGGIVATITHRRARGPVNIIHSENWLVYTYYNVKVRRTELTSVELYEGNTQANSTIWTSFDAPPLPTIEQQAFIVPANVVSLRETITEKGITSKHVLVGLSSGAIVELPWHILDPRRPTLNNQPREEGTLPYIPELPLSSESVINYNQSVGRIREIYTAPSGLESTCLVIAYGLDFFSVRISPSRTFDLLKEDFDYFTLSAVLLGLTIASFVVKHMSAKKALKQAWK